MSDAYSGTPSADSYYERLGVDREASDDDLDRAAKLAKRAVHPDNNSSEQATAEREFDRVTDAGDVLTDSESRAAYDTFIDDQGAETGTERYEQWDAEGRPQPPTEWLAQPRSNDAATTDATATADATTSSTTATGSATTTATADADDGGWTEPAGGASGDRDGWSEDDWNTRGRTRDEQRGAGEPDGAAASGTASASANADAASDGQRTTVHTGDAAAGTETTIPTGDAATTGETADAAADATAADAAAADAATTTGTQPNRSPRSVLNRDPDEMYAEFVLDSDPEWGTESADSAQASGSGGSAGGRGVASAVAPAPVARLLAVVAGSPLGGLLTVAAPRNRLLRGVVAAALVGLAVAAESALGGAGSALVLAPLVVCPRLGPWLFGALAAATAAVPATIPLAVPAVGWLALAGVAGGYYLLVRGSRLDPYATA